MPARRIGIDVVPLSRVRELVAQDAETALRRMLSAAELLSSSTPDGPDLPGIAGRLAAKEAVFKLFHVGGQPVPWLSTEVLKSDGGWPVVRLTGRAARLAREAGLGEIEISITHDDAYAIAVAVSAAD
ncbi:holo-ACP synthase [Amycolatopsis sp. EV170708-02-1]|uniref:holo-ACP synthase n=1 Tax=Amycolatopsis sp. EV170708-02-1 TaxID=2919322 RepID=UPI001F0B7875|nr:holo-ACP synthase [Amycolatopsis sp. EV170708-02-1]UMP03354.1 holo-ACP synthase [Amycolatopsis sp. EV170708-02-1]